MSEETLRTMRVREQEVLNQPSTLDDIYAHILGGGSLVDLAETWEIPFGRIRLWMAEDENRDKAYIKALNLRAELEAEKIKRELNRIAYADFQRIYEKDGTLKPFTEWPKEVAAAVQGLKYEGGRLVDFKAADKVSALVNAGKAIAMFRENIKVDGNMTLEQMLVMVDKQAREAMSKPTDTVKVIEAGEANEPKRTEERH
jgi:hypothetical protein